MSGNFKGVFGAITEFTMNSGPLFVAVGMFDGVHLGHQSVIECAERAARAAGGLAGVLTFWPHPSRLFRPEEPTRMIFDPFERREILRTLGVDFIIEQPFDREFAAIEAEDFLPFLKKNLPGLDSLYVGENWRFGRGRKGDVALLVRLAREQGIDVVSAERLNFNGEPVSSTRIRFLIAAGGVEEAHQLLDFPYFSRGCVVRGRQLGNSIGFPTLNMDWTPDLQPAYGVYAVRVRSADGGPLIDGVANFGVRPTVDDSGRPVLEVHLLGECPFSTDDCLHVQWLRHIRPEMRFASIDDLKAQIGRDRDSAIEYFRSIKSGPRG